VTLLFLTLGVETLEQACLIMELADVHWHVLGQEDSNLHQRQRTRRHRIEAVPAPSNCFNLLQVVDMAQRLQPKNMSFAALRSCGTKSEG
jgi:hypothetical protein